MREPRKAKLTEFLVQRQSPQPGPFLIWDLLQRGLVLRVQPSGYRSYKVIYNHHGRTRWFHIGAADAIGLADARRIAGRIMVQVSEGKDPAAERKAERGKGTFAELAAKYVEQHSKKTNKSWKQADALVRRFLIPHWGKLQAGSIARTDVKAMMGKIAAPHVANLTLAAASAIFSWAAKEDLISGANPCRDVPRNPAMARERVLSDSELPQFWAAMTPPLKMILLTGQRPGEVRHMRWEHIVDGWWQLPGEPVPAIGWPGTKNAASHRVWLPGPARDLLPEPRRSGFVFPGRRGNPVDRLEQVMKKIYTDLGVDRVVPHDLRRVHGTWITRLGFGREAMNSIQNHREGGIATVYDRHQYGEENQRIMEAVASDIMTLVEGRCASDNVVRMIPG
jgi:integrase